ncbi:MAG: hypothetical protein WAO21_04440 [Verrucomicrobiia bacterium]
MADSTYLKNIVEPFIVQWVSRCVGLALQPRRFPVGPRTDGTVVNFEFDGVSEDGQTSLLVSTSMTVKPGGTRKLHVDASILLRAAFQRRIMAFVSDDVRQNFLNKCDGLLELSKIEMLVSAGNFRKTPSPSPFGQRNEPHPHQCQMAAKGGNKLVAICRLLPPHICRHLPPSAEGFYHTDALLLG